MEKTVKKRFSNSIYSLCVLSLICNPFSLIAECECFYCKEEKQETPVNYDELGEYADMFIEFEEEADKEDERDLYDKSFFLKKWCKKIKKWFKKKIVSTIKKLLHLKKKSTPDECAYEIARLKRKIDKKLYNTGKIDEFLSQLDKSFPESESNVTKQQFFDRVKYYSKNKKAKPNKTESIHHLKAGQQANPQLKEDLENTPPRVVFGYLEVGCGFLVCCIPFPGCSRLGGSLIAHGFYQIYEGRMQEYEKENGWHVHF